MFSALLLMGVGLCCATGDGPAPDEHAAYEAARAEAGRDPESHVKLALWCEARGMAAAAVRHLTSALLADPKHALARRLMGLVEHDGEWDRPEAIARKVSEDAELAATLAEYNARRARIANTADSHWRLGLWCEQHGLTAEAFAHFTTVTRLDPSREAAWKRVGCRKVGHRWVSEEQLAAEKAERKAQAEATVVWTRRLARWREALADPDRRAATESELAAVEDRHAVAAIWKVFANRPNDEDQFRAIQLLGQIDSPGSSRALVALALGAPSLDVRRAAAESLARRDPLDYMGGLIAQVRPLLRYEVRPVGGPGSPGALFVEGDRYNRLRVYAPPALPFQFVDNGVPWGTDEWGFPVIRVPGAPIRTSRSEIVANVSGAEFRAGLAGDAYQSVIQSGQTPWALAGQLFKPQYANPGIVKDSDYNVTLTRTVTEVRPTEEIIPIGRIVGEYQKSAMVAQEQLRQDVAAVERMNQVIKGANDQIADLLNNVTGQNLPSEPASWQAWYADQRGYAYTPPPPRPRPTIQENVPLAYLPRPVAGGRRIGPVTESSESFRATPRLTPEGTHRLATLGYSKCCFAADTPVWVREGTRPIRDIQVGDLVLSQGPTSGALHYRPVLAVYHFRPSPTCRIVLRNGPVISTPLHRFWKAGQGWVMARDLKPGDTVRTSAGLDEVQSIEPETVRPVFNLEVAEDASFFVGTQGVLVHDNTPAQRRETAFDAIPELASVSSKSTRELAPPRPVHPASE